MEKSRFIIVLTVVVVVLALMAGCTGNGSGNGNVAGADSLYKWENVRQFMVEEPELALRMIDTAEIRGVMSVNEANFRRSCIYYESDKITDYEKAKDYCMKVLNSNIDSTQYITILSQLVAIFKMEQETYPEAIRYAMEGAQRAHHAGDVENETFFYYEIGLIMEDTHYGSGIQYIDRSLNNAFAGDGARVQQYYDYLEPIIHERFDTISNHYIDLLNIYSYGLYHSGRYREAYETLDRRNMLNDSVTQREHQQETLNEHYVSDAISACNDGKSTTDLINGYRLRYATHLLSTTNDSIALIAELCGLSRRTFYRLFNEAYSMSPSDYRKVANK